MASAPTAVKVVLLDIEGTVCPISFVKDVLFPYALKALPGVLEKQWDEPEFAKYKDAFPDEHSASKAALESHVRDLVAKDVKIAYLKDLQGYLWKSGYESGDIKAPLFPDVPSKLKEWHDKGLKLMIYSSGSVPAQKLLFGSTDAEPSDLTPLISDWFDTVNAGLKTEVNSYETIAGKHPEIPKAEWLFLSDNVKEVDAAIAAGMQSLVVQRPGNAELAADATERLQIIDTFVDLTDDFTVNKQVAGQKRSRPSTADGPRVDEGEGAESKVPAGTGETAVDGPEAKKQRQVGSDVDNKDEAAEETKDETVAAEQVSEAKDVEGVPGSAEAEA